MTKTATSTKKRVDFFIVGEAKSGTTALAHFLDEHPEIGISRPKEPHYFATDLIAESNRLYGGKTRHFDVFTPEQYQACFAHCGDKRLWGEGSTHYACSAEAAQNIHRYNPAAKIIIMLRNPVDFLHSLHMQYVNNATDDEPDFATALAKEPDRRKGRAIPPRTRCVSHLFYSERVDYAAHIKRFFDLFPPDQIMVIINEEFNADNAGIYRQVLEFLGAEPTFQPEFRTVHGSKTLRFKSLHGALNNLAFKQAVRQLTGPQHYDRIKETVAVAMLKKQPRQPLDPQLRKRLKITYKPNVIATAKLIGRPELPQIWGYGD